MSGFARVYVGTIIAGGMLALVVAVRELLRDPPGADFYYLAALTAVSALLPVRLHKIYASISAAETFVFASMILYGPAAGALLVCIDASFVWLMLAPRGIRWLRIVFSLATAALSMGAGGYAMFFALGSPPFSQVAVSARPDVWLFVVGVFLAVTTHFVVNSVLVAGAIALEQREAVTPIWYRNFSPLFPNYLAAGSLAALLVHNVSAIPLAFLLFILPPLLVLLTTYRAAAERVKEAEQNVARLTALSTEVQAANLELVGAVSHLRSTQAQLVQSEKLSAVGLLVAGVAHEVNNPLTVIGGYAELLQGQLPAVAAASGPGVQAELSEMVAAITSETTRAAKIVRNLLMFSRKDSGPRAPHNVVEVCEQVLDLDAYELRKRNITASLDAAPALPPVLMDVGQIQQVILNLVTNAMRAMLDQPVKLLTLTVHEEPACGAVVLDVRDTGHGIDADKLHKVFDPFFTTRPVGEGTGLGLSLVHGIVRSHGGAVAITTEVGVGTTFSVRLPAWHDPASAESRVPILVAVDETDMREYFLAMLGGWGLSTRSARTVDEALDQLAVGVVMVTARVVQQNLDRWRTVQSAAPRPPAIIGLLADDDDPSASEYLRATAAATIAMPHDLCQIRRALDMAREARR